MIIVLPLEQLHNSQFPKKPIGLTNKPEEQGRSRHQAQYHTENFEISELEKNSEEEQFTDFDSFMAHHNTYQASEHIRQEYHSHLQDLDDDQYYTKIDRADFSQSTPAA